MLNSLNKLSGVAVDTVDQEPRQLVADLQALADPASSPTPGRLPKSLQVLLTYPFTDHALK